MRYLSMKHLIVMTLSNIIKGKKLDKDEKLDHKVDPIAGKKPRTSIPSNSGRIKPGHQPT